MRISIKPSQQGTSFTHWPATIWSCLVNGKNSAVCHEDEIQFLHKLARQGRRKWETGDLAALPFWIFKFEVFLIHF